MPAVNTTTLRPEPEEIVEQKLVALLAAACTIPVYGLLSPSAPGTAKSSSDSFVSVAVDQTSQELDDRQERVPRTFSATVAVRYALADDPSGISFRDECRRIRAALIAITGDDCSVLTANPFYCDGFILTTTSASFDATDDNPCLVKTYNATIYGRTNETTNTAA